MSEEQKESAYRPKPSLKDRLGLTKESLTHIVMAVIIAVIISAVVFTQMGVSQGAYNTEQAQQAQSIATQGSEIASNDADISDLQDDLGTIMEQYDGVANTVALHTGSIEGHGNRLATLEGNVTTLKDTVTNLTVPNSPPEAYLTGMVGNYTIHAKASEAGNYTGNIHLVFASGAINWTTTVNWTATNAKDYVAVDSNNATIGTWWNVGKFALAANNETAINVLFGGLADTVSFAYVEIYPVLE